MANEGLRAHGISVRYGGVVANDNISISVAPKQVVGLIGPNGAGKTTFIDGISGFTSASGTVTLDDRPLDDLSAHARRQAGLSRTWQAVELFENLTVLDSVLVAERPANFRTVWRDLGIGRKTSPNRAMAVLEQLGLADLAHRQPNELSLGTQKLVGVARAMAGECKAVLLDEPAAGLDNYESKLFGERLLELAESGLAILLVDHDIDLVFQVCGYVYVLDFGKMIAKGAPAEVRQDERVLEAYLGAASAVEVEA